MSCPKWNELQVLRLDDGYLSDAQSKQEDFFYFLAVGLSSPGRRM